MSSNSSEKEMVVNPSPMLSPKRRLKSLVKPALVAAGTGKLQINPSQLLGEARPASSGCPRQSHFPPTPALNTSYF